MLLSTMPLNHLIDRMESVPDAVASAVSGLHWSGSHIVGVGVDRAADTTKNWIYFPEPDVPFYRVTYLSNYSPYITPEPDQTLFLTETSRSRHKPEPDDGIVERVIDGLETTGLMQLGDRERSSPHGGALRSRPTRCPARPATSHSASSNRGSGNRECGPGAGSAHGCTRSATWITRRPCRASRRSTTS